MSVGVVTGSSGCDQRVGPVDVVTGCGQLVGGYRGVARGGFLLPGKPPLEERDLFICACSEAEL